MTTDLTSRITRGKFGDKMAELILKTAPAVGKYEKTTEMLSRYIDCAYQVYVETLKTSE